MSQEDPAVVVEKLNASGARLIGDRMRHTICFGGSKKERQLLSEAGDSFCLPIMKKELMETGTPSILRNAKDLTMKTFIAL